MGKKVKLDMSGTVEKLIKKTKEEPYWGTGGSKGSFNVNTMKQARGPKTKNISLSQKGTNV